MRSSALLQLFRTHQCTNRVVFAQNGFQSRSFVKKFPGNKAEHKDSSKLKNPANSAPSGPKSWLPSKGTVFLLCGSVVAGAYLYKRYYIDVQAILDQEMYSGNVVGHGALGSEWALTDQFGRDRKSDEFKGQYVLLYFGFTRCPDVCPVEIEKMCAAVDRVDKFREVGPKESTERLYKITPLMITVDPERDTPEVLKEYCSDFSPKLVGLTGTTEQIDEVSKAFRVYHARTRTTAESDQQTDYLVDHTIVTYLIGPSGEFVDYYGQYKPAEDMAGSIIMHMMTERNKAEKAAK